MVCPGGSIFATNCLRLLYIKKKHKSGIRLITMESSLPNNSYTDTPQAHPNLILGSLQLAVWIFFHPTAWRNHIKRIDENLQPDFSLAELKPSHWRHPALRRLLIQAYLILPVIIALLFLFWSWRSPGELAFSTVLSTIAYSLIVGITASVAVGIGGNLAFGLVSPVMKTVAFNLLNLVNSEVADSVAPVLSNAVTIGVTYGVVGSMAVYLGKQTPITSLKKRVRGIAAGALCFWVVNLAGSIILSQAYLEENLLTFIVLVAMFGLVQAIALGFAVGWELNKRRRGITIGIGIAFFLAGTAIVAFGKTTGMVRVEGISIPSYAIAFSVLSAMGKAIAFALPFVIGRRIGGAIAGVGAFVLCGILRQILSLILEPMTGASAIDWQMLPIVLLAINLGLTQTKWRSLLLYPLMVAWNFLSVSRLRLNSAFWDEFQRLPLLGLEEQLVVTAENKPAEGHSAIAYLKNTDQKQAARSAKIELTVRSLENCNNIEAIARASHQCNFDEPTTEIPVWIEELLAISGEVEVVLTHDNKEGLTAVVENLKSLGREMNDKSDRYAFRCQNIVDSWQEILEN